MMEPAVTVVPSNCFTPRRCAFESRPLRVDPPPLVLDISNSSASRLLGLELLGRDGRDLQRGVVLAVAPAATLIRLGLVRHGVDLGALLFPYDLGLDRGPGQLLRGGQDGRAVDNQDGLQRHLGAHGLTEELHADALALGHALLLPSGPDHRIHKRQILAHQRRTESSRVTPRPPHTVHSVDRVSSRPSETRLRVISTSPSSEMSKTWVRVLSRDSALRSAAATLSRFSRTSMSMKSITMMPPMSRSRSWRATSSAASRLLRNTVSSRFVLPTFLPVLTSITVRASVRSMISEPPEGNHTLRSSALCSCSCTW